MTPRHPIKRIVVLVGPKGSGKSAIGSMLERELGVKFVRVEPLFLETREEIGAAHPDFERIGFQKTFSCLVYELSRHDTVCFESTGASEKFHRLLTELRELSVVLPVQVQADPMQCVERIRSREPSIHIPVSDDQVERINTRAVEVELPWAARIDNRAVFDPNAILETIRGILGRMENEFNADRM